MTVAGYQHEIGLYGSDQEFRALVEPLAEDALDAHEPVVFAYESYKMALLRDWLPDSDCIIYLEDTGPYSTPARAIASWRSLIQRHLDAGASRVRVAGNVPHEGYGRPYAGWDRYEAAIDRALGDLPVWAPCLYDQRITPEPVLERAVSMHRHLLTDDGEHVDNDCFQESWSLSEFLHPPIDALEASRPAVLLENPSVAAVRAAVRKLAAGVLCVEQTDALLVGASEVVTNAHEHGMAPVCVSMWAGDGRVVVRVHDGGSGPADPFAGLFEAGHGSRGGRGLWLTHCLDLDVALVPSTDGFSVRLRAGEVFG